MADDRNWQKQHIRAARDWLGKAESSLEQQNDVEGDLKLMLARAELSHVKESPQSQKLRHFANRIVPLAVAVLLLVVGSWGWQNLMGTNKVEKPLSQVAMPMEQPVTNNSDTNGDSVQQVQSAQSVQAATTKASEVSSDISMSPVQESDSLTPAVKVEQPPATVAAPSIAKPAASEVPSLEKQQLMQAAGKALRQ